MIFEVEDVVLRTTLAFVLMLIATRFLGKKMIGTVTYADYIGTITLGSLTGGIVLNHAVSLRNLVLAIIMFAVVVYLGTILSLKNKFLRRLIAGTPIELVRDGQILEENLKKAHLTVAGLAQQLRLKNVFNVANVKQALLETNGRLSVLLIPEEQNLTVGQFLAKDLRLYPSRLPVELIMDGEVITDNLVMIEKDLAWLLQELEKRGVADYTEVAYLVITSQNNMYIDLYKDNLPKYPVDAPKQDEEHRM